MKNKEDNYVLLQQKELEVYSEYCAKCENEKKCHDECITCQKYEDALNKVHQQVKDAKIINFIESVLNAGRFAGCKFLYLDDKYALVFAYDDEHLFAKIAYNCDSLQCDYDYDWYMPEHKSYDGDLIDAEIYDCETKTAENIYEDVKTYYAEIIEYAK